LVGLNLLGRTGGRAVAGVAAGGSALLHGLLALDQHLELGGAVGIELRVCACAAQRRVSGMAPWTIATMSQWMASPAE
jgi:hypothetical protein